jgi:hypothetical protein
MSSIFKPAWKGIGFALFVGGTAIMRFAPIAGVVALGLFAILVMAGIASPKLRHLSAENDELWQRQVRDALSIAWAFSFSSAYIYFSAQDPMDLPNLDPFVVFLWHVGGLVLAAGITRLRYR